MYRFFLFDELKLQSVQHWNRMQSATRYSVVIKQENAYVILGCKNFYYIFLYNFMLVIILKSF